MSSLRYIWTILFVLSAFLWANAQTKVSTQVIDSESLEPLQSVHIIETNQPENGTITGASGFFAISIRSDFITISHIGYESQTIHKKNLPEGVVIRLRENIDDLDQVVVTGNKTGNKGDNIKDRRCYTYPNW